MANGGSTLALRGHMVVIPRFEVVVVDGPDRGARASSRGEELTIGTSEGVDLQLADPGVSRQHCVLRTCERGIEIRDLGSRNGTFIADHEIVRAFVRNGSRIRIGNNTATVAILDETIAEPLADEGRYGELLGASPAMRRLYPMLERCAQSDATVLIHGETGTGKELVAEAIHLASARRGRPFVVVDCGALPRQLAESELFGHARGAFTGADTARAGVFEEANGGTIFLDEIGELPFDVQPLLLRAIENHTIRRVGTNQQRDVDVRLIAASHRDLRVLVNEKRFRADLFYRLNVVRIVVPPLRERDGDVELLAEHFWRMHRPDRSIPADLVADLVEQAWPGNVRELRNAIERAALTEWSASAEEREVPRSYGQAKERAVLVWERRWIERLLEVHGYKLAPAARTAQMGRSYLRQLVRRHGVVRPASADLDDDDAE